jgi:hypothetical protein
VAAGRSHDLDRLRREFLGGKVGQSLAARRARVLERKRARILGALATIVLLAEGTGGRQFDEITTVEHSFFVERKSHLAIGTESLDAEIAEQTGVDHAACLRLVAARFAGRIYKASVVDEFIDAARVLSISMTPGQG